MAAAERLERGYLGSILRLTLLAPDIVEAILDGRTSSTIGLPTLIVPLPEVWLKQCEFLSLDKRSLPSDVRFAPN